MRQLDIAMVQDDWWPRTGGGPVHVKELSKSLANEYDCRIDVYTRSLSKDGEAYTETTEFADGAVTVYRLGPCTDYWNPVGRATSLVSALPALYRNDYDVIHGHTFLPALPTQMGARATGTPNVFTVHGTALNAGVGRDTSALGALKRRVERRFILNFDYDHVVSVNQEHVPMLEESHDAVSCIPNGVDLDRFDVDESTVDGRILFLGRLAPKKRVSDLIRAFNQMEEEYDAELVIVGEGPQKDELEKLTAELGLTDRVTFAGRVDSDEIPRYYASAELFVLPSVWEGHPLTLLEAWAAGCPVIASDVEGIAEFVEHGETGHLVEPEQPAELADALRYAFDNPDERREWGEAARATAQAEFSWETAARKTRRIYDTVVSDSEW
jgi:glycosyltransferase involved in cell wall biosynthesis